MSDAVITIRGKLHWAKIVGDPRPHVGLPKYDKGPKWSVDVTPDEKSLKLIRQYDFEEKLRDPKKSKSDKETRTEKYLSLTHLAFGKDGKRNDPPKIYDIAGQPWDGRKIGNETIADVKIKVKDYGRGSEKGVYLQGVRILSLVPYEEGFEPLSEDDEFFSAARGSEGAAAPSDRTDNIDDLDDDVPF